MPQRGYIVKSRSAPQERLKYALLLGKSQFYTVFGRATPRKRDTFLTCGWKSRFYDDFGRAGTLKCCKNHIFLRAETYCILKNKRDPMEIDNFTIPGFSRSSPEWIGSGRRASEIIGFQLKSFWKPSISSGGPGRERPGIEILWKSFRNPLEIL